MRKIARIVSLANLPHKIPMMLKQCAADALGPLMRHLNTYVKVKGFVFGWFGEISTDLDQAMVAAAKQAVKRLFAQTAAQCRTRPRLRWCTTRGASWPPAYSAPTSASSSSAFCLPRRKASLRRTHARARVFRESDLAVPSHTLCTYDHYRSRVNAPGSWRDITPCH